MASDLTRPIESVRDYLEAVDRVVGSGQPHAHVRMWFRGQNVSDWKLEPLVFRSQFRFPKLKGKTEEQSRLNAERHITQDFMTYSAHLRASGMERAELYAMQQHYRAPTRLLDWSTNPLVGLFFAVYEEQEKFGDDAAVHIVDAYQFPRGLNTSRSRELNKELKYIYEWNNNITLATHVLALRPSHSFGRVTAQSGFFTLCNENVRQITKAENPSLTKLIISGSKKGDIIRELSRLDVNRFSIYGDLDNLSSWIKSQYN